MQYICHKQKKLASVKAEESASDVQTGENGFWHADEPSSFSA